ncbi:tubulin/FtsZ family protein [Haladaptatus sp. CMSO5]|uniref:tubulin/FtsZ family protein n=1 Tax=Haladaptatus sp. CMSO5 TaxID=3120514 RepID=UPI002FCE1E67
MKVALIGVGQAGGKVVEALIEYDLKSRGGFVAAAIAVNTAKADLLGLKRISERHRVLIGQYRVKGHGVGADNELGSIVATEDIGEVLSVIDDIPLHNVDAFLIVAGLGGGTGSGGAPVIARELKRLYTEPVYGLGLLPSPDEGGIYTLNAARSFQTFVREVDNLLVFDNDAWRQSGESVQDSYGEMNAEIARRLGLLFSSGEATNGLVPESVVDASELINTLGSGGVSTIGYAVAEASRPQGLLARFKGDEKPDDNATNRVLSVVRRAALGRLSLPCNIESTERALLIVAGRPKHLDRKGIERGRKWLEAETGSMEVRGGDYPIEDTDHLGAVVLLSGVYDVPRIKELQQVAIEAQQNMADRAEFAPDALASLMDTDETIEPLF